MQGAPLYRCCALGWETWARLRLQGARLIVLRPGPRNGGRGSRERRTSVSVLRPGLGNGGLRLQGARLYRAAPGLGTWAWSALERSTSASVLRSGWNGLCKVKIV
ncbi:MAG TPA: hypothetical protein VFC84_20180 [Desulfosporosinus sp.]|nr:hypothetical protein [Desulfosporosinus sp.]